MAKKQRKSIQQSDRKTELLKQNQTLAQKINELRATAAQLERQAIFNAGQIALLDEMEKKKEVSPDQIQRGSLSKG